MAKTDHTPAPEHADLQVPNQRPAIDRAEEQLLDALARHHFPDPAKFAVRLAIEEALVNAFRHGHKGLPADTPVRFSFQVTPDEVVMEIEDRGPGFNPDIVKDPTAEENLELSSGRGLLLMRSFMTSVEYLGNGNRVRMVYRRPTGA